MADIGVLGAGTWGMALTRMLSLTGHDVTVWSALPQEIEEFSRTRRQPNLPGMIIPDEVIFTSDIRQACESKDMTVVSGEPDSEMADMYRKLSKIIYDRSEDISGGLRLDGISGCDNCE